MKKLIEIVLILCVVGIGAAAAVGHFWPDSEAGRMVWRGWDEVRAKYEAVRKSVIRLVGAKDDVLESADAREPDGSGAEEGSPDAEGGTSDAAVSAAAIAQLAAPESQLPTSGPEAFVKQNLYKGTALSQKTFKGKVVLVYVWDKANADSVSMLPRIENLWQSFKGHPLVVVGSHRGGRGKDVLDIIKKKKVTFPVYEGAGLAAEPTVRGYPFMYITDHEGKLKYMGKNERSATEVLVNAIGKVP